MCDFGLSRFGPAVGAEGEEAHGYAHQPINQSTDRLFYQSHCASTLTWGYIQSHVEPYVPLKGAPYSLIIVYSLICIHIHTRARWVIFDALTFMQPIYMSPEVWTHGAHSIAADSYAFGVCLWELATGQEATAGYSSIEEIKKAVRTAATINNDQFGVSHARLVRLVRSSDAERKEARASGKHPTEPARLDLRLPRYDPEPTASVSRDRVAARGRHRGLQTARVQGSDPSNAQRRCRRRRTQTDSIDTYQRNDSHILTFVVVVVQKLWHIAAPKEETSVELFRFIETFMLTLNVPQDEGGMQKMEILCHLLTHGTLLPSHTLVGCDGETH